MDSTWCNWKQGAKGVSYGSISQKSRGCGHSSSNRNTEGRLKNDENAGKVDLVWEVSKGMTKEKQKPKLMSGFLLFSFPSASEHEKLTEAENLGTPVAG